MQNDYIMSATFAIIEALRRGILTIRGYTIIIMNHKPEKIIKI